MKTNILAAALAVSLLALVAPASADLIWQGTIDPLDSRPHGPWDTTTANWFNGSTNVVWNSGVAQFGTDPASTLVPMVAMNGTVQAAGMHLYETAMLGGITWDAINSKYVVANAGTIQFTGANPTITVSGNGTGTGVVGANVYLNTRLLLGSGQTLRVVSDAGASRYTAVHLYSRWDQGDGGNVIDVPIVVGDASANPLQLVMRTADALGSPGAQGSASITINPNATMQFYPTDGTPTVPIVVTKPIILNSMGAHLDLATNGGIVFQSVAGSNTDLAGGITLTGDSTILSRGETHFISGPISGQYALTIDSWNKTNVINLNGAAKSVKSLRTVSTGYGDNSGRVINITAPFTVTDSVTIEPGYRVYIYNDGLSTLGSLTSPLITSAHTKSYIYTPNNPMVIGSGQTIEGHGTFGNTWTVQNGGIVRPGVKDSETSSEVGSPYFTHLNLTNGGVMEWQLGNLKDGFIDSGLGVGVAGVDYDYANVSWNFGLGGTSTLKLDWSLIDDPDTSTDPFWQTDHSWAIGTGKTESTETFASILNGDFTKGDFTTARVAREASGTMYYDVMLYYDAALVPGDASGDGKVDATDAQLLASKWGTASGAGWGDGDFNGDGAVNAADASILAANWGFGVPAEAAGVPEPSCLILLSACAIGFAALRRR